MEATKPHRRRLPNERTAITHKFEISGHEGYITVGLYPDGQPGEIFLKMAKEGSTVSGLMDTLATSVSLALQYGVPLKDVVNKFAHVRFEPSGFTGNSEIPIAKSIVDYVFRWVGSRFLASDDKASLGLIDRSAIVDEVPASGSVGGLSGSSSPSLHVPSAAADAADASGPSRSGLDSPTPASSSEPTQAADAEPPTATAVGRGAGRRSRRRSWWSSRPTAMAHGKTQREREDARAVRREPRWVARWRPEGRVRDPGRRPVLRRLRLDHGPQRQLLQVPQLREHLRLLLM